MRDKAQAITLQGTSKGKGLKFAIVVARFNDVVTDRLEAGALEALAAAGVSSGDISVIKVPGAFEIPFAATQAAQQGRFAAVICLGCLIRGATAHFEYIATAASQGIMDASLATGVPMTFGVLTTNSKEEALERAMAFPGVTPGELFDNVYEQLPARVVRQRAQALGIAETDPTAPRQGLRPPAQPPPSYKIRTPASSLAGAHCTRCMTGRSPHIICCRACCSCEGPIAVNTSLTPRSLREHRAIRSASH